LINITIPDFDMTINRDQFTLVPRDKAGIYFIYDKDKNLLYIGKSMELWKRVKQHAKAQDWQLSKMFSDRIDSFSIIFISCPMELDIYETYLINTLRPIWNGNKTFLYTPKHIEEKQKRKEEYVKTVVNFEDNHWDEEFQKRLDAAMEDFSL
jgi:hypothetical protein